METHVFEHSRTKHEYLLRISKAIKFVEAVVSSNRDQGAEGIAGANKDILDATKSIDNLLQLKAVENHSKSAQKDQNADERKLNVKIEAEAMGTFPSLSDMGIFQSPHDSFESVKDALYNPAQHSEDISRHITPTEISFELAAEVLQGLRIDMSYMETTLIPNYSIRKEDFDTDSEGTATSCKKKEEEKETKRPYSYASGEITSKRQKLSYN